MAAPIAVLRAMLLAGMTTACFDCQGGYYATVQPNFLIAPEGDLVNFTCSTNLMVTYPKWKINDNVYDVTNHPHQITFEGMNIKFGMPQTSVQVRCFISTFIDGEVVDICSNIAITLLPERPRRKFIGTLHYQTTQWATVVSSRPVYYNYTTSEKSFIFIR
jgi:hypothetical protein